ncbi:calexcitin-1-like [Hyalella azteca]|uniref:Calexcitin-1-like n=1 Tax=Hyalella azteca TaxID=294128 RepID=A0A8B7P242_HYAAZ|nr:calexcitin-1-like [Hyalella azteca]
MAVVLSPFRKSKLLHVFNTFFDVNQSGEIDENDLELAVKSVCGARGWGESDPHYANTQTTLRTIWRVLTSRADKDNDSKEDSSGEGRQRDKTFRDLMFLLEDSSGDGAIDVAEYTALYVALGIPREECQQAFNKLSKGEKEVTKERFDELWEEYFHSEDRHAPGNFIFGVTEFASA